MEGAGRFIGKRIVLGVTGSIAAYKAVSLLRALVARNATVSVVMTESAMRFVTPLTFEVLSGHPVATDLFAAHQEMVHLTLAEQADLIVVAPATAQTLARCALGLADDLLGATLLAARCPLILAPAMDGGMWDHPAVRAHVDALRARNVTIVDPDEGPLASGRVGKGRLAGETALLGAIDAVLCPRRDWAGQRVLISAGPTEEPIDPVRVLTNRSSGKMGYAIAAAARERGAAVVLVSGPTSLAGPPGVEFVPVQTAEEMHKALVSRLAWSTVVIMAAAVADFRPKRVSAEKLKRQRGKMEALELEPTTDIVADLACQRTKQMLVGFAAETRDLIAQGEAKLRQKNLDFIIANDVSQPGAGIGSDVNAAVIIGRAGVLADLPLMPKRVLADRILDVLAGQHFRPQV